MFVSFAPKSEVNYSYVIKRDLNTFRWVPYLLILALTTLGKMNTIATAATYNRAIQKWYSN